jgi:hypothetical protein
MLTRMRNPLLVLTLAATLMVTAYAKEDPNKGTGTATPDKGTGTATPPTVSYVMASPRACLTDLPNWAIGLSWLPGGAAENFPRADGTLRVVTGTKVVFGLGERSDGVWYSGTYGTIAMSLEIQRQEGDADDANDHAKKTTAAHSPVKTSWVTLGKDGVKDTHKGPGIGHGDVSVAVRFPKAGTYTLRGIISTEAQPLYTEPLDKWRERLGIRKDGKLPEIPAEVDRDVVNVKVVVVDTLTKDETKEEMSSADPEAEAEQGLAEDKDARGETDVSL